MRSPAKKTSLLGALLSLLLVVETASTVSAFSFLLMGARRGKGNLKRTLDSSSVGDSNVLSPSAGNKKLVKLNNGKGQEITGVTLPQEGMFLYVCSFII